MTAHVINRVNKTTKYKKNINLLQKNVDPLYVYSTRLSPLKHMWNFFSTMLRKERRLCVFISETIWRTNEWWVKKNCTYIRGVVPHVFSCVNVFWIPHTFFQIDIWLVMCTNLVTACARACMSVSVVSFCFSAGNPQHWVLSG